MWYWNESGHKTYLKTHMKWFKTTLYFNTDNGKNDRYWWRFKERIVFNSITKRDDANDMKDTKVEGEVYVVTADGQSHKIATYTKKKDEVTTVTNTVTDKNYGDVYVDSLDNDSGWVNVDYWPSNYAIKNGIKKIYLKNNLYFYDNKDRESGYFQYEKDLDISSFSEDNPMKAPTFAWNEKGNFDVTVENMKDFSAHNNNIYSDAYYEFTRYFRRADGNYVSVSGIASTNDMERDETSRDKYEYYGTTSWEYTYNDKKYTEGAFTTPVLMKYYKKLDIKAPSGSSYNDDELHFAT